MQINTNSLLQEMQSLKTQVTPESMPLPQSQEVNNDAQSDFGQLLSQAIGNVNQLQATSASMATGIEMGDPSISLSDTVIAREKAGVAFEATVQVRNKLVEAYKDIMSMPV